MPGENTHQGNQISLNGGCADGGCWRPLRVQNIAPVNGGCQRGSRSQGNQSKMIEKLEKHLENQEKTLKTQEKERGLGPLGAPGPPLSPSLEFSMFFLDFLKVFQVFHYFLTDLFDSSNPFGNPRLRVQNFAREGVSSTPRLRTPRLRHSEPSHTSFYQ